MILVLLSYLAKQHLTLFHEHLNLQSSPYHHAGFLLGDFVMFLGVDLVFCFSFGTGCGLSIWQDRFLFSLGKFSVTIFSNIACLPLLQFSSAWCLRVCSEGPQPSIPQSCPFQVLSPCAAILVDLLVIFSYSPILSAAITSTCLEHINFLKFQFTVFHISKILIIKSLFK